MPIIRALRYTGTNLEDVMNFSPQGEIVYAGDASLLHKGESEEEIKTVFVHTPRRRRVLAVGEWVALDDEGNYHVLDDECFEDVHRVVDGS